MLLPFSIHHYFLFLFRTMDQGEQRYIVSFIPCLHWYKFKEHTIRPAKEYSICSRSRWRGLIVEEQGWNGYGCAQTSNAMLRATQISNAVLRSTRPSTSTTNATTFALVRIVITHLLGGVWIGWLNAQTWSTSIPCSPPYLIIKFSINHFILSLIVSCVIVSNYPSNI